MLVVSLAVATLIRPMFLLATKTTCLMYLKHLISVKLGNSLDKLRHTRSVAYSVELVVLNKHQISDGGAYLDYYL